MADQIIITEDKPAPPPDVIVVKAEPEKTVHKVVTEKTTVVESSND